MLLLVGRLGFKLLVQVACLFCNFAVSESMPPRTLVHCPGCPRTYASKSALRKHRGHRCSVGTPCYLDIHQPARVSRWVAGACVGPGRLQITEMDMFGARSRSPSPDPGDDEGPPPPDFDEDDLGPPAPAPAVSSNLKSTPYTLNFLLDEVWDAETTRNLASVATTTKCPGRWCPTGRVRQPSSRYR
jgi:hypothetical protein